MKAAICDRYGGPENIYIADIPVPEIKRPHDILVRVHATAVNSGDVRIRALRTTPILRFIIRLIFGLRGPRKKVLGLVFSGVVEKIGTGVTSFRVGDAIFGMNGISLGAHAEYLVVSEKRAIAHKPETVSFEAAAAAVFGGTTALYFLGKAGIKNPDKKSVLIYGATGAVGAASIQIARHFGHTVTAICGPEGTELCKKLGADRVLVYTEDLWWKESVSYDIVFDAVGKIPSMRIAKKILAPGGAYVTVGGLDTASEHKEDIVLIGELLAQGTMDPVIDHTYPLDEIRAAHEYVDSGKKKGNVVIAVC
jgi:NADPH:quinone reductase-like Zn-dependent oxidoreductase